MKIEKYQVNAENLRDSCKAISNRNTYEVKYFTSHKMLTLK